MSIQNLAQFYQRGPCAMEGDIYDYSAKVLGTEIAGAGNGYPPRIASLADDSGFKLRVYGRGIEQTLEVIAHASKIGLPFLRAEDLVYSEKYGAAICAYPSLEPMYFMFAERAHGVTPDKQRLWATLTFEENVSLVERLQGEHGVEIPLSVTVPYPTDLHNLEEMAETFVQPFLGRRWIAKLNRTASGCAHVEGVTAEDARRALRTFAEHSSSGIFQLMVGSVEASLGYFLTDDDAHFLYSTDQIMKPGMNGKFVHDGNHGTSHYENLCRQSGGDRIAELAQEDGVRGFIGVDFMVDPEAGLAWPNEVNARIPAPAYTMAQAYRAGLSADHVSVRNIPVGGFATIAELVPRELWLDLSTGRGVFCTNPNFGDGMAVLSLFGPTREYRDSLYAELLARVRPREVSAA